MLRVVFLFLLLLPACASAGNPAVYDHAVVDQIQIGTSTKGDVQRLLGAPSLALSMSGTGQYHESWRYTYAKHESNPLIYFPFIGPLVLVFQGAGRTEAASFSVYFDRAGVVRGLSKDTMDLNLGGIVIPTSLNLQSESKGEGTDAGQPGVRYHSNTQMHSQ